MAVGTPLRFVEPAEPGPVTGLFEREIVSTTIAFDGREFGWVMPEPPSDPDPDEPARGPTLTTLHDDNEKERWKAQEAAQRFLSALAFYYDVRMESRPTSGGSGERDLLRPFGTSEPRDTIGITIADPVKKIVVAEDAYLRLALAVYREGLNAGSPFYRFLAYWNVINTVLGGKEKTHDKWLRREAPRFGYGMHVEGDVAKHLREASRHAIAHVLRKKPKDVSIDPDRPVDRARLDAEGKWMQELARRAIDQRWPRPVDAS